MFNIAVVLIVIGVAIGLYMAIRHFRGHTPPRGMVAAAHGLLNVSAVILLLVAALKSGALQGAMSWALVLFGIAALGGIYLATRHMDQKPLPGAVIVVHALVAVVAFLITLTVVYFMP